MSKQTETVGLSQPLARKAQLPNAAICYQCGLVFDYMLQTKHSTCPECNSSNWERIRAKHKAAPAMFEALACIEAIMTQPVQTSDTTYPETCRILRGDCAMALRTARAALAQAQGKPI